MITSATLYHLTAVPAPSFDVLGALAKAAFTPCEPTQERSAGWVAPRLGSDALCECINGQMVVKLMIETKKVPADLVARNLKSACEEGEILTGRKPSKKARSELKYEIIQMLLPKAFPAQAVVVAWIDPVGQKLVVGTSSKSIADLVASSLVAVLDGLEVAKLQTQTSPATAMTDWLLSRRTPETLAIEDSCELKTEGGTKVKYIKHNLNIPEIGEHINADNMNPSSLDLTWLGRVNFTLTDALVLKKIDILGNILEGHPEEVDAFDADVVIATTEINGLIADLILELDGESEIAP